MATQLEIAQELGISDRWLRKLVSDGAIRDRGRGGWDALDCAKDLLAYREREIERLKAENASLAGQLQRTEGDNAIKSVEDARHARARADKAEMEVSEMRGQLIPADQVADMLHMPVMIMKTRMNAIPARAAPLAHAASTVAAAESILREQIDEALAELGKVEVTVAA